MKPCLLLITISWFGTAYLQHIDSGPSLDIDPELDLDTYFQSANQYPPLPYRSLFRTPSLQALESFDSGKIEDVFYNQEHPEDARKRRMLGNFEKEADDWLVNQIDDAARSSYYSDLHAPNSTLATKNSENGSDYTLDDLEKRNFSPWGGKRGGPIFDSKWYWKRAENMKEPSMPKRVRFSPWGGKRGGQFIYKAGGRTIPDFTDEMQAVLPSGERVNIAGIQFLDKRHPINVLTLSTDGGLLRRAMPFKSLMEQLPKFFKIGHPYSEVNLKKDGKRKVKFSAWGGKRSPPIIGPIWTPAPSDLKESTLNAILLIRNNLEKLHANPAKVL